MLRLLVMSLSLFSIGLGYDVNQFVDSDKVMPCKLPEDSAKLCYKTNNHPITNTIKTYYHNKMVDFWMHTPYIAGRIHGLVEVYEKDGTKESTIMYHNGKRTGITKVYYKNGQVRTQAQYANGIKQGIEKEYDETGYLRSTIPYANNKRNGTATYYYPNGTIANKVPYQDDLKQGVVTSYYENGEIYSKVEYKANKKHGKAIIYYSKADVTVRNSIGSDIASAPSEESYYLSGNFDQNIGNNGGVFMSIKYQNDKIISGIQYDPLGKAQQMDATQITKFSKNALF